MKIELHIHHHLGAEELKVLSQIINILLPVERKLDAITETLKIMGALQEKIDRLTETVENNTEAVKAAIKNEGDEIKRAIDNPNVDTSAFEAAVARSQELTALVNNLYTAPGETPPIAVPSEPTPEPLPPVEPAPPQEPETPTEEMPENPTSPGTDEATGDETTGDVNQPFDPNPAADESNASGFDDQERTPVPQK